MDKVYNFFSLSQLYSKSNSLFGILKAIVVYGIAANKRYLYLLSTISFFYS